MAPDVVRSDGIATPASTLAVLDDAVRQLALEPGGLRDRVFAAARSLGSLSSADLLEPAERAVMDRVRLRLMALELADFSEGGRPAEQHAPRREQARAALAADIVDLRGLVAARVLGGTAGSVGGP